MCKTREGCRGSSPQTLHHALTARPLRALSANRSEGFPRTRITKKSCACDCGRGNVSVGAFFFLSSFSFFLSFFLLSSFFFLSFFSHAESHLKIKIFVRKSDVLGGSGEAPVEGGREQ